MDAQEFYLYFDASYVLTCQLELKLWKCNYKNLFEFGAFSLILILTWQDSRLSITPMLDSD